MVFCVYDEQMNPEDTCYHTLVMGKRQINLEVWWNSNDYPSYKYLHFHDDVFGEHPEICDFLRKILPEYDQYDDIYVTETDWNKLLELAHSENQLIQAFCDDIDEWARPVLGEYGGFTIIGI